MRTDAWIVRRVQPGPDEGVVRLRYNERLYRSRQEALDAGWKSFDSLSAEPIAVHIGTIDPELLGWRAWQLNGARLSAVIIRDDVAPPTEDQLASVATEIAALPPPGPLPLNPNRVADAVKALWPHELGERSAVAAAPAFKFQRGPRITTGED
jgi:hypothetical protein